MSKRRFWKKQRRRLTPVLAFCGGLLVRLLSMSYRLRVPAETEERLRALPSPAILAFWHQEMLSASTFFRRRVFGRRRMAIMASQSEDGELVARVASSFGVRVVRGSASRGGTAGLRALYREVVSHGSSIVLLLDGPRGPLHQVKPGAVVLAQMARAPILPMAFLPQSYWEVGSWDRMRVPKPGTRIEVLTRDPLTVPRSLDDREREAFRLSLEGQLKELSGAV